MCIEVCGSVQVGEVRVSYMYAGSSEKGREDVVSRRDMTFLSNVYSKVEPLCRHHWSIDFGLQLYLPLQNNVPYSHSRVPILQVSIVGRQSPGPVITQFSTSDGYRVLFLYMERLSMDVS